MIPTTHQPRTSCNVRDIRAALLQVAGPRTCHFYPDLHWADSTTVRVLRYLIENCLRTRRLIDPPDVDEGTLTGVAYRGLVVVAFGR